MMPIFAPENQIPASMNTMPKRILALLLAVLLGPLSAACAATALKPRVVVLTDIAPGTVEPDDMESMVRLLAYADVLEIEAIITSTGWNCDPYPDGWADSLQRVIDAYEHDVPRLMKRSGQRGFLPPAKEEGRQAVGYWVSPAYLRSRAVMGSRRSGIAAVGAGNESAGSDLIIRLADENDPRPIWVCVWGGANTLAQAIWQVQQQRTAEELKAFLHKLRVYTITDQDMPYSERKNYAYSSHQWMRQEFADDLMFLWDESAWLTQCELGSRHWQEYATRVQGRGRLGSVYPKYKYGVEGDTPSFLYVIPNGLHDTERPAQAGWTGCFARGLCADSLTTAWTNWQQPQKGISRRYEERFYDDIFNDFAARMEWAELGTGNRNPVAVVNGRKGTEPVRIRRKAGQSVTLDASRSSDPDGHRLSFRWWVQEDIGYDGTIDLRQDGAKATLTLPADLQDGEIHIICEVRDDGEIPLVSYRRVIISRR